MKETEERKEERSEEKTKDRNEKRQKRGLYFALAVCLVAIAVAGSATYTSVMEYVNGTNSSAAQREDDPEERREGTSEAGRPQVNFNSGAGSSQSSQESSRSESSGSESSSSREGSSGTWPGILQGIFPAEKEESENSAPSQAPTGNTEPEEPAQSVGAEPQTPENDPAGKETGTQTYQPNESLAFPVGSREALREFSSGRLVYSEEMRDYRTHDGVDLAAQPGEKVLAVGNGLVTRTYRDLLLGNVIEIEHGEFTARYCGLGDTFLVEEGEILIKGTPIGSITEVPMEAGAEPHLHLELRTEEGFIDPLTVLSDR